MYFPSKYLFLIMAIFPLAIAFFDLNFIRKTDKFEKLEMEFAVCSEKFQEFIEQIGRKIKIVEGTKEMQLNKKLKKLVDCFGADIDQILGELADKKQEEEEGSEDKMLRNKLREYDPKVILRGEIELKKLEKYSRKMKRKSKKNEEEIFNGERNFGEMRKIVKWMKELGRKIVENKGKEKEMKLEGEEMPKELLEMLEEREKKIEKLREEMGQIEVVLKRRGRIFKGAKLAEKNLEEAKTLWGRLEGEEARNKLKELMENRNNLREKFEKMNILEGMVSAGIILINEMGEWTKNGEEILKKEAKLDWLKIKILEGKLGLEGEMERRKGGNEVEKKGNGGKGGSIMDKVKSFLNWPWRGRMEEKERGMEEWFNLFMEIGTEKIGKLLGEYGQRMGGERGEEEMDEGIKEMVELEVRKYLGVEEEKLEEGVEMVCIQWEWEEKFMEGLKEKRCYYGNIFKEHKKK